MSTFELKPHKGFDAILAQNKSEQERTSTGSFQIDDQRPVAQEQMAQGDMALSSARVERTAQLQDIANVSPTHQLQDEGIKKNNTGLPDNLKSGIENLSGVSLDDVNVHRNSDKPAQMQAHAYAQGSDIHLGPGQDKHLPHEAWHVVQQKQGRVQPTKQINGGVNVNDNVGLENEADVMGSKAAQMKVISSPSPATAIDRSNGPLQRMTAYDETNQAMDPRHFSTTDLKAAIDACIAAETPVPGWLQDQVAGYLRDELLERMQDMMRHGGGDPEHQHYFEVVKDYVQATEALKKVPEEAPQIPTGGPALQLKNRKE